MAIPKTLKRRAIVKPFRVLKAVLKPAKIKKWHKEYGADNEYRLTFKMLFKIAHTCVWEDFEFREYFMYHFQNLNKEERTDFLPDWNHVYLINLLNDKKNYHLFQNKDETYEKFKEFYKRELIKVTSADKDKFAKFLEKHKEIIVKPIDLYFGRGVQKVSLAEGTEKAFERLNLSFKNGFICEELIIESEGLAKFHPQSVNTLRMTTLNMGNRIELIYPLARLGVGDSVVDNAGSGGIICSIDPDTGVIFADCDEHAKVYQNHPDTNIPIIGAKIPRWEEAKEFALNLAKIIPENRWTGWDMALTDNGWVLVEGNYKGQILGWQMTMQKGYKAEFKKYYEELGLDQDW